MTEANCYSCFTLAAAPYLSINVQGEFVIPSSIPTLSMNGLRVLEADFWTAWLSLGQLLDCPSYVQHSVANLAGSGLFSARPLADLAV
jgi:hypothetical protein